MSIDVDVYTLIVLFSWAIKHCNFTWNNLGTLSKDHPETQCQQGQEWYPIYGLTTSRTPTLYLGTYLYGSCKGVSLPHAGDKPVKQGHQSPKFMNVCTASNQEGTRPWDLGNRQCCWIYLDVSLFYGQWTSSKRFGNTFIMQFANKQRL